MSKQVEVPKGVERLFVSSPLFDHELVAHPEGSLIRVKDLEAIYKHFCDRLLSDEAVARGMRCLIEQGRWTPTEGSDEEPPDSLNEFRDAVAATLDAAALQTASIPETNSSKEVPSHG